MCGRYGRWSRRGRIEELLGIEPSGFDDFPDLYNITPSVETWIARAKDGNSALYSYLWGLVPYWSKDPKKGARPDRHPVSRRLNSPKNDDAKLIEPEPA
jgi:putative SOS response-associated peptidase YedK